MKKPKTTHVEGWVFHVDEDSVETSHLGHPGDLVTQHVFDGPERGDLAIEKSSPKRIWDGGCGLFDGAHDEEEYLK